jgi:hypothetical protein
MKMKYYLKPGATLLNGVGLSLLWLLITCLHVFWPSDWEKANSTHFYQYMFPIFSIMLVIHFIKIYKYILLWFKNEPMLEVNESYILDCANKLKYFWDDIENVSEEGGILYIKVNDTEKYLTQFKNRISRRYNYSTKRDAFILRIDCVKAKTDRLINTMNDYSIKAMEMKEGEKLQATK